MADPQEIVSEIYAQLGLELSTEFAKILEEEAEKARHHKTDHQYSLEGVGFTKEQILTAYQDVYERWGFDRDIG